MDNTRRIFKRKLYHRLLEWKETRRGSTALLIEGARRVGKSTLVREFAKNEYESYVIIDFSFISQKIAGLFKDIYDLDNFFMQLQFEYNVQLKPRKSLIVFDEVQLNPLARQAIKHLVADGRFDYIETGSLISIRKNVRNILIPSEEEVLQLYPLDYEEFRWALGDEVTPGLLRQALKGRQSLGAAHRKLMRDFRLYMLVGGMPQAVDKYIETLNLAEVDSVKRNIINLYEADFNKIDGSGRIGRLFDDIPAQLGRNSGRYMTQPVVGRLTETVVDEFISEMSASMTVNMCCHTTNPANGLAMDYDKDYFKLYCGDTGLLITLAFKDKDFTDNIIYQKLLSDKLEVNLGYVYENVVAQILVASGRKLFYYTFPTENKHLYEVDFIISDKDKLNPIEVKSSGYKAHASLDAFCEKYSYKVRQPLVVYTKDFMKEGNLLYIPVYMLPFIDSLF